MVDLLQRLFQLHSPISNSKFKDFRKDTGITFQISNHFSILYHNNLEFKLPMIGTNFQQKKLKKMVEWGLSKSLEHLQRHFQQHMLNINFNLGGFGTFLLSFGRILSTFKITSIGCKLN